MSDPLAEVIALLQPRTVFSKGISGAGRWAVRYSDFGQPSFCVVLEGSCRLAVDGQEPITLEAGDFVLLPATPGFTLSGFEPVTPVRMDPKAAASGNGRGPPRRARRAARRAPARRLLRLRLARRRPARVAAAGGAARARRRATLGAGAAGRRRVERAARRAATSCSLASSRSCSSRPCARRRATTRRRACCAAWPIARIARGDAAHARRPRARLDGGAAGDEGGAVALGVLRALHAHGGPAADGIPAGLAHGRAKDLLRRQALGIAEVAERVGYGSASTFSTAFSRHVGQPPGRYAASRAAGAKPPMQAGLR